MNYILYSYQKHQFVLRLIKRVYYGRTKDDELFYEKVEENQKSKEVQIEIKDEDLKENPVDTERNLKDTQPDDE